MSRRTDRFDNSQRDHIKDTVTMERVLEILNLEPPNRNGKIRSIINPGEHTPSLHIYSDHWYDYSTGEGGDQIKFVQVYSGCSYREAIDKLSGGTTSWTRKRRDWTPPAPPNLTDRFDNEPEASPLGIQRAAGYVTAKWPFLTLSDIIDFGVKACETSLWAPHRDASGAVRGIKIRDVVSNSKFAVTGSKFTGQLYRVRTCPGAPVAMICEGESDLWCLTKWCQQSQFRTLVQPLSLPAGAATWRPEWHVELSSFKTVIVMLDGDIPGQAASQHITQALGEDRTGSIIPPHGRLAESMPNADHWLAPIIRRVLTEHVGVDHISGPGSSND